MWGVGVVLYEMMCLRLPFDATSMESLLRNIVKGTHAPIPKTYSAELRAVFICVVQATHALVNQVTMEVNEAQMKEMMSLQQQMKAQEQLAKPR